MIPNKQKELRDLFARGAPNLGFAVEGIEQMQTLQEERVL
jgi:hypothetical protein